MQQLGAQSLGSAPALLVRPRPGRQEALQTGNAARRIRTYASSTSYTAEDVWDAELRPGSRTVFKPNKPSAVQRLLRSQGQRNSSGAISLTVDPRQLQGVAGGGVPMDLPEPLQHMADKWSSAPARYKLCFATMMSFVICNMDKVNVSVAIIPMAQEFGWDASTAGLVQSAFFGGYMLSQIPGGYLTARIGGRTVLPGGVGMWSVATAAVPALAGTVPGLMLSRAAVGLGEGIAPSAATDVIARSMPETERARAVSFVFTGLPIGSLAGLLAAPPLIEAFGWQSVFFLFGAAGLVWVAYWERLLASCADEEPEVVKALSPPVVPTATADAASATAGAGTAEGEQQGEQVPWRAIVRSKPFWALAFTHFCNNWLHYTFMAWLPTYFTDTLSLDLTHAAQVSLLPPVAAIFASAAAGSSADHLLSRGVPKPLVRKAAQCTAFLVPAALLTAACMADDGTGKVGLITAGLGMASFSLAGLYCNHGDLSPKYGPFLLGCTNTVGAVPGIVGIAATGIILDATGSWELALFAPSIALFLMGSAVFVIHGRAEEQDWSDDSPFPAELRLRSAWRAAQHRRRAGAGVVDAARAGLARLLRDSGRQ